jgi:hypothetical protein
VQHRVTGGSLERIRVQNIDRAGVAAISNISVKPMDII